MRVNDKISNQDVIVSNQVSFLEYIFLEMAYGPVFTQIAFKGGKYGVRKVGMLELPFIAIGLKFPKEVKETDTNFFVDLKALRDSLYVKSRPILVFPEGTKTNGRGILHVEDDIVTLLSNAANSGLKLHSIRFDYEFDYASPTNTTDVLGLKTLITVLT